MIRWLVSAKVLRVGALAGACALAAAIVWMSHLPQAQVPSDLGTGMGDKAAHVVAYFVLSALVSLAIRRKSSLPPMIVRGTCSQEPVFRPGACPPKSILRGTCSQVPVIGPGACPPKMLWRLFHSRGWAVFGLLAVFAAADEVTQAWVGRACSLTDWTASMAGVGAGIIFSHQAAVISQQCFRRTRT